MNKHFLASLAAATAVIGFAAPALAQEAVTSDAASDPAPDQPEKNVFEGNHLTIGVGAVYSPSYRGSNSQSVSVFPAVQAKYKGISLNPRAGGVALDLIPDKSDAKISFQLGPVATVSFNRNRDIRDSVVRAAGKLHPAIEVGGNAGVSVNRLLDPYDQLTFSVDVKRDVNGAYSGWTYQPSVSYLTPLSKAILATVSVNAHHAGDKYANYYYSVTPLQSERSGLPGYNANGGWDSAGATLLVGWDLSGDLRNGGFMLFGIGNYSRQLNDGKDTPYTSLRGQANQWTIGGGVGYTF